MGKFFSFLVMMCLCNHALALTLFDSDRQRLIPIQLYEPDERKDLPVVIINHGYTVSYTEYSFIADSLIRLGYVVISVQHDLPEDPELPRKGNLFERRMPFWERGVDTLFFVLSKLNVEKVILIGHSNGGDISMLFAGLYSSLVEKVISLDSLRMPFPVGIPILTLRANDTKADAGVLPSTGITSIQLDGKHMDMCDRGSEEVKSEIMQLITSFVNQK